MYAKDLIGDILLSNDDILERVDEYSLYCHYLGYEPIPGTGKYRSPIRPDDEDPSFGIFYSTKARNREFLWKDQATGEVGDIFYLVQRMFPPDTKQQARDRIINDMGLDLRSTSTSERVVLHDPPASFVSKISVIPRSFTTNERRYWDEINISAAINEYYKTTAVDYYWLAENQEVPYKGKEFTFSYQIWDKYKIYQPYATKDHKFRHNFTEQYIEGLLQLQYKSPLLVITKSSKDIQFLFSLGYEAISPRSENTPIGCYILDLLKQRYKTVVTLFDNDGKHKASHYTDCPELHVPINIGYKDPTDVARFLGVPTAKLIVDSLLKPYL